MQNVYKSSIILSFFGLFIGSMFSAEYQSYLGFFLIFTFGIIHGTNDLLLLSKINENQTETYAGIFVKYIFVILLTVLSFKFMPLVTLIFFIGFSAYHFGEQHFEYVEKITDDIAIKSFQLLYGLFVLLLLFYCNTAEVIAIIREMTLSTVKESVFFYALFLIAVLLILNGIYIGVKSATFHSKILIEIFYIVVFAVIFKSTTLIWGFALYFILWHSIPSIISQVEFIHGQTNKHTFFKYIKTGVFFWLISMIAIAIIFVLFKNKQLVYTLFFSFIISITFPHVIIIQKMFSKKRQ